ncbi:MAG: GNAT family N-acetyltransferase [Actinomycetales bacterium]|nr:GNAT family N-acetyltransferase [Actinomycetales bacterium]
MTLFTEHADVSVRPATREDAATIAHVQLTAWRSTHAQRLAGALEQLDESAFEPGWADAITQPPGPGHRVLVACAGARVVGFAAVRPAAEGTGEIVALEVLPDEQRSGHGSRLLSAAVDSLRQDGAESLTAWVLDGDDARERFLGGAGLGPDGRVRELAAGHDTVHERRWAAEL